MSEASETTAIVTREPIGIGQRGIQITTLDELWRFSQYAAKSEFVPKELRGDPGSVLVACEYALELGIPLLQGLQNIMVVNGRGSIWGDLMLALVEASGLQEDFFEDFEGLPYEDTYTAICITKRRGRSQPTIRRFSVLDAKVAKLWGKSGPWATTPQRMLQMRARGFALRDTYADVLRGLYAREELQDVIVDLQETNGVSHVPQSVSQSVPDEICQQLKPPPTHPTADNLASLQELALACGRTLPQYGDDVRRLLGLPDGSKLTKKLLRETMTTEQYDEQWTAYQGLLRQQVEADVPMGDAPASPQDDARPADVPEGPMIDDDDVPDIHHETRAEGEVDALETPPADPRMQGSVVDPAEVGVLMVWAGMAGQQAILDKFCADKRMENGLPVLAKITYQLIRTEVLKAIGAQA